MCGFCLLNLSTISALSILTVTFCILLALLTFRKRVFTGVLRIMAYNMYRGIMTLPYKEKNTSTVHLEYRPYKTQQNPDHYK